MLVLVTHSDGIAAQRRAEFSDPEQIIERQTWTRGRAPGSTNCAPRTPALLRPSGITPGLVQALVDCIHDKTERAVREAARRATIEV